ncbi:bifunctional enoyl-CoA hydratase/phosphate acetyltransferase [Caenimonas sp. S4]|nr:bifunctional enoyl-CoA hydratase/phosphate acetyltransferase [Caenimonas soli]
MPAVHQRLNALVEAARRKIQGRPGAVGVVYPCNVPAIEAAAAIAEAGIGRPLLIGPCSLIERAADDARIPIQLFEIFNVSGSASEAARMAALLARDGSVESLMKGSLHTDELMGAVVRRENGLRGERRISHAFIFDLPRYSKLLAVADCVVNIAPDVETKKDILGNSIELLQKLGVSHPKVGIVAAVEMITPAIPATLHADALVRLARAGQWPGALVEGPFGFDNAISMEAARIKGISSSVTGDADLLLVPDLNSGNMLYKSFNYIGGGDCAGLVLGAKVPIILTSRADSKLARLASAALSVLCA